VVPSLEGKIINSPFLYKWTHAALQGVNDAAKEFAKNEEDINPNTEIKRLLRLSEQAKTGEFTGMLPEHTETWSDGSKWKEDWRWGKIPPLK
jgi:hypothetical protein